MTDLENGDEVEIIRSKAQTPPAAWEGLAVTGKARAAIRRATRMAVRNQYAGLGREIMQRVLARHERDYSNKEMAQAFPKLGIRNVEDGLAAVGRGELSSAEVLRALGVEPDVAAKRRPPRRLPTEIGTNAITVRGLDGMLPIQISQVTGAVPGERIVGIMTPGEGVTVYPIFSKALVILRGRAGPLDRSRLGHLRRDPALSRPHQGGDPQ